ncbi:MAG: alpha-2-macroglobulin, partial [Oligoflexales bacterium]|nr:alpha-2-macroglobulin [Oligoflexales bacterium]
REIIKIGPFCSGKSDKGGILVCELSPSAKGNMLIEAVTKDKKQNRSITYSSVNIYEKAEDWQTQEDDDRMDLIPERKRYEPSETAVFKVGMPFREATALITVEREGIMDAFVRRLSGDNPLVEIPVKPEYAPNVYVSVLALRGRLGEPVPTARIDLGKPSYKLGIAGITVGQRAHELKVSVASDKDVYKVREKVHVKIHVESANKSPPGRGSEVIVAAVDDGLLQLRQNESWNLLDAMMAKRSYQTENSITEMHVIGKRHFGLKALSHGGGGGMGMTRELFDALIYWNARIPLDSSGNANVEIPLNDSITSFHIEAIASSGLDKFGSGSALVRTTQDIMAFSSMSALVREKDRFNAEFTIRNNTSDPLDLMLHLTAGPSIGELPDKRMKIAGGESQVAGWKITAPERIANIEYELTIKAESGKSGDKIRVTQKVAPRYLQRVYQSMMSQIDGELKLDLKTAEDALPSKSEIDITVDRALAGGLSSAREYMTSYPYACFEQEISRAVVLDDRELWDKKMAVLPTFMDKDGLVKYFPSQELGSETLTSYLLSVSDEANLKIPDTYRIAMLEGLGKFVTGKVLRMQSLKTADLALRKIAAIEALSRYGKAEAGMLTPIDINLNLWPSSAVIDYLSIMKRIQGMADRAERMSQAENIIGARLNFTGSSLTFSSEERDRLYWLMVSPDVNIARLLLVAMELPGWKDRIGVIAGGVLSRQVAGHWDLTNANSWAMLAIRKFSRQFEKDPVGGRTSLSLANTKVSVDWSGDSEGGRWSLPLPDGSSRLMIRHEGTGKPWAVIRSRAFIPLKKPIFKGFEIKKTITAVERKSDGKWTRGDMLHVRLDLS